MPAWRGGRGIRERERELDRLAAAARDAADGAGSVVLVHGEAGIGRSSPVKAMPGGDRPRVYDALRAELVAAPHPAVLVVEDVHGADVASLDALRFLVHRVERLPAVLVLTYRDDAFDRRHPCTTSSARCPGPNASTACRCPGSPRTPCADSAR
ncbi:putative ATPase [Streptomyces sp. V3I8]|uniref:AAA family ATPase n=1 Tax=Streptomyces sp. V3I8 TaxID=3042279 RepID=UPI002789CF27|nr:ATP-binding protein [Streptomyces sp. V3I8]MDQ1034289.1 putative ATPase [Streptomyces sp. V3I8]